MPTSVLEGEKGHGEEAERQARTASPVGEDGVKRGLARGRGKVCGCKLTSASYKQDGLQRTLPTKACGCTWGEII